MRDWFPVLAWATLIATLMAVIMGGVVRVTGSGLGCPDWPLCHGRIIPPWDMSAWVEYTHRLSAAVAGVFTFLLVASAFNRYTLHDKALHVVLLVPVLLLVQAGFGAYTVLSEISPKVALVHTGIATGLVGLLALVVTGAVRPLVQPWQDLDEIRVRRFWWAVVTLAAVAYIVIMSGAYVTRTGASLACEEIPLCGAAVGDMAEVQWNHMAHRGMAFLVGILMVGVLGQAWALEHKGILFMAGLMGLLLAVQIGLGISNVVLRLPPELRALHLATAALFFAVTMFLVGSLWRGVTGEIEQA